MKQLDPKSVWQLFISNSIQYLVLVIFLSFWCLMFFSGINSGADGSINISFDIFKWLWLIIPLVLIFSYIWAKLTYNCYRYELTDAGFHKELGVIYKKDVVIPYDRIQNIDINRGIVARILGLSDLNIQTAGMSATIGRNGVSGISSEGRLPALSYTEAIKLRDELIKRTQKVKNQGL